MLASMTSSQVAEWMAFARLEQVGNPVYEDEESATKRKRKDQRHNFEAGMRALQMSRK